jgi:hypothetical protein
VALGRLDPSILGRYLPGVVNDDFNGMVVIASCRLTTSRACAAWRQVVGPPDTIVVHHEWATGWRYTVAAYC